MKVDDYVLDRLRHEGLTFERSGSDHEFRPADVSRSRFLHVPVLSLPPDIVNAYLKSQDRPRGPSPDSVTEAVELTAMHVVESLTTDHGDGLNATTAVGFRRGPGGSAEFFVEVDRMPSSPGVDEAVEWITQRPT